ncbi:MAG TPA: GntR family transcriptional regulator [Spirochaetia bacterium]|nr:GntR family transcriptional regulator [Spirochaetia bacterium]
MRRGETKYEKVKRYILGQINSGKLKSSDQIPTEDELIRELVVSRNPVRRAISELVHEGWIYTLRGSGSFVRSSQKSEEIDIYVFLSTEHRRFETEIIQGARLVPGRHSDRNIRLILQHPGTSTQEQIEMLSSLRPTGPGGVLFLPVLHADRAVNRTLGATLRSLERPNFTVVQLDRTVPEYEGNLVMTDHRKGVLMMIEYLYRAGHREVAVLYEHPENTSTAMRLEALKETFSQHGLELPRERQILIPFDEIPRRGSDLVRSLMNQGVTVIFCFENAIARNVCDVAEAEGIRVPEDLSLCSFDDHSFADRYEGFITCVRQQLENIGLFAVDIVLRHLDAPFPAPIQTILDPQLIVRRSVARLHTALR